MNEWMNEWIARSMNIDDQPTERPTTDLTLWKIKNGHNISAMSHPIHFVYVRPLYFAFGHYTSLLTLLGDWRLSQGKVASRPTVWKERNERELWRIVEKIACEEYYIRSVTSVYTFCFLPYLLSYPIHSHPSFPCNENEEVRQPTMRCALNSRL